MNELTSEWADKAEEDFHSADLMAEVFPDVPLRGSVTGTQTLLSIEKARRVLGYEPEYSWREARA